MNKLILNRFPKLFDKGQYRNQDLPKSTVRSSEASSTSQNNSERIEMITMSEIKRMKISDSKNVFEAFDSKNISDDLMNTEKVLFLQVQIESDYDQVSSKVIQGLNKKFAINSVVILLSFKGDKKLSLHWKSKDIKELLTVKHSVEEFSEEDRKIYEYVAEYLANSLSKGELGLYKEWTKYAIENEVELYLFADSRSYNLLLHAAEAGNVEIVQILLNYGANTVANDGMSAQLLAWKNRHSKVLVLLAKENLPYPEGIDINQLSSEFKAFYRKTEELHEAIVSKNEANVKEILKQDKNLEFYFDLTNQSAAKIAIDAKAFNIYEILLVNEIFLAPHEYQQGVFDQLEYHEQKIIRELHHKHSKNLPDKHINILMANSFLSHDVPDAQGKLKHIKSAYKYLSQDSRHNTILKVVAASKKFKIIYDFNRDAVNIADPTVSENTEGVFYPMGRIYIGARQLLDDETRNQAIGTLAHELCHFAINLVYSNFARPYKSNNHQIMQEFEKISEKCQKKLKEEEIIERVYDQYPVDMHHAELIVRAPHIIAMYYDQPERLAEVTDIYPELFKFFEKIIKEMKDAIPEIERREEMESGKKDEKISKLRKKLFLGSIFSVIGIIVVACVVALIFYKPTFTFSKLSDNDKARIRDGLVDYKNIQIKFRDLFPGDSIAYEKLTSQHMSQIFDGQALNFSDPYFIYLSNLVHHDWGSLTDKLKEKFLSSNFTFQNESLKFKKLNEISPGAFDFLTSRQITDVLDGQELIIGKMIKNKTEFYVEKKFVFEGRIDTLGALTYFNTYDNLNDVIDRADKKRMFILSSEAGAGKTVAFEQLTMKIKKKYPAKWVSYIDLKDYTKFYNANGTLEDVRKLLKMIFDLDSKTKFEKKLFDEYFETGNVVLLWNGFDEISPTYSKFILNVLSEINLNSKNVQYVCTRPLYSGYLMTKLNFFPYQLLPFNNEEKNEFLTKFLISQNVSWDKINSYAYKVQNISTRLEFNTPLMLKLIAEIHDDSKLLESENFYKIYENFVIKKVEIWQEKSEFAKNITNLALTGGLKFDLRKIYQKYALLYELSNRIQVKKLEIMKTKIPKNLPYGELTRMGILYINTEYEYVFAHRTFAEFFVAQFFIENIYLAENNDEFDETLFILFDSLKVYPNICKFLVNFLDTQDKLGKGSFTPKISQLLRTKYRNFLFDALNGVTTDVFEMFFKFFNKDHKILVDLLHLNEDETLYTKTFDPLYIPQNVNPLQIKELAKKVLTSSEFSKFLTGRNQKGKILFGLHYYKVYSEEKIHNENISSDVNVTESSVFNFYDNHKDSLTEDEQKELLVYLLSYTDLFIEKPAFESIYYENLWINNIDSPTKNETKDIITNAINGFSKIIFYLNASRQARLLNFLLKKMNEIFTNSEICEIFNDGKFLHRATILNFVFENLWNFFEKHTNETQRREMLLTDDSFGLINFAETNGAVYSIADNSKFKIFHFSLFNSIKTFGSFLNVVPVYEKYFNTTEIQNMILGSNDFMIHMIDHVDQETCKQFFEYLKRIFKGNEENLKKFLTRRIEPTEYNIYYYFYGLGSNSNENVKILTELYYSLPNV